MRKGLRVDLSKDDLLHLATAASQRRMLGVQPSGDLRMCRKFNRIAGKKQFCLAEYYGDNLSIPLLFFVDRPTQDMIRAAKELALREIESPSVSYADILREQSHGEAEETERR